MFKSGPPTVPVPSKSQSIRPRVVSDVKQLDRIDIDVPSYLGFIDPTQSFLKMIVEMDVSRGEIIPDPVCGAHSFFRNVIIRDGSNQTTIESIEDYNSKLASVRPFTAQADMAHKRALFEGVQPASSRGNRKVLYYASPPALSTTVQRGTVQPHEVEVYLPLSGSGLWSQSQILPVGAMNGMRIQIDTEDVLRACVIPDLSLSESERTNTPTAIASGSFNRNDGAGNTEFTYTTGISSNTGGFNNHFAIGDKLYLSLADGSSEVALGFITGFSLSGSDELILHFVPPNDGASPVGATYPIGSKLFYKVADRQVAQTYDDQTATSVSKSAPDFVLKDLELLCMSCSPPSGYIKQVLNGAQSDAGVEFDFIGSELSRFNQVNTQGVSQVAIHTLDPRAKSILVQPLPVANYRSLSASSFKGVADGASGYQFVFGTELQPTREVPLSRYSQAISGTSQKRAEPLHLVETQKALQNIGERVMSLQRVDDHFLIARGLNRYNQITDLSDESVSLRVQYPSAGVNKTFNCYVYGVKRMVISKGMVEMI